MRSTERWTGRWMPVGAAAAALTVALGWGGLAARVHAEDSTLTEEDLPPAGEAPPVAGDEWDDVTSGETTRHTTTTTTTTVEEHEHSGGAAGKVEGSMEHAGDATRGGIEKAGAATGRALDKAIDKTGEGIGYVIDKTGKGLKSAGEALSGDSR